MRPGLVVVGFAFLAIGIALNYFTSLSGDLVILIGFAVIVYGMVAPPPKAEARPKAAEPKTVEMSPRDEV